MYVYLLYDTVFQTIIGHKLTFHGKGFHDELTFCFPRPILKIFEHL